MKTKITFAESVNWEYVSAHHKRERDGKVKPGPWCKRIIEHARENGYKGKITAGGACRIINALLGQWRGLPKIGWNLSLTCSKKLIVSTS